VPSLVLKLRKKTKKNYKKHKKTRIMFVFSFILLFFLLIINISDIFSSIITNKNSLFFKTKLELPSYSVYAVSLKDFQNFEQAKEYGEVVKSNGAAGYVYQSGEYFVFASSYPSLMEAKEIQENLKLLGYNSRIVNIKIDAISKEYRGDKVNLLQEGINFLRQSFLSLYQATISFDKQLSNQNQVNSIIAKLLTQLTNLQTKLLKLSSSEDKKYTSAILKVFDYCKTELEKTLFFIGNDNEYTSKLKNLYLNFSIKNKELVNELNSI